MRQRLAILSANSQQKHRLDVDQPIASDRSDEIGSGCNDSRSVVVFPIMKPMTPRTPAVLATLAAVLVTSACGQATPSPGVATPAGGGSGGTSSSTSAQAASTQTVTVGDVRLEATMAPGGPKPAGTTGAGIAAMPGLVVDYTVTNTGSKPLLAYDVVPADLGSAALAADVDAKHAWVYEQSGVLRISKQGFATSPNVRFAAAPVMGGHVVPAGASVSGKGYAASPLKLDVPGESFVAPRAALDPGVKQWQFCVQVADRAAQSRPSAVGGGVVEAASMAPQGDELVCTPPAPIPVS